jgi:predicted DNA-binding transcriptional regulator AlpA
MGSLLPARVVWERLGICDRTLDRWIASDPSFPQPKVIRRRRYWDEKALEGWLAAQGQHEAAA